MTVADPGPTAPHLDLRAAPVTATPVRRAELVLMVVGALSVVAGGIVAAATGPLSLEKGSWAAAYLVLVCGAASVAVGGAQTWLVVRRPPTGTATVQVLAWLLGNAAVLTGTLVGSAPVVLVGGGLLVVALLVALVSARRVRRPLLGWGYRLALAVVAVSIPVGLVLSVVRNG